MRKIRRGCLRVNPLTLLNATLAFATGQSTDTLATISCGNGKAVALMLVAARCASAFAVLLWTLMTTKIDRLPCRASMPSSRRASSRAVASGPLPRSDPLTFHPRAVASAASAESPVPPIPTKCTDLSRALPKSPIT